MEALSALTGVDAVMTPWDAVVFWGVSTVVLKIFDRIFAMWNHFAMVRLCASEF